MLLRNNRGASTLLVLIVLAGVLASSAIYFTQKTETGSDVITKAQSDITQNALINDIITLFRREQNCAATLADLRYVPGVNGEIEINTGYDAVSFNPQTIFDEGADIDIWIGNIDGVRTRKKVSKDVTDNVNGGNPNPTGSQSNYCSKPDGSMYECVDDSKGYRKIKIDRVSFVPLTEIIFETGEIVTSIEQIEMRIKAQEYVARNKFKPIMDGDHDYISFPYGPIWVKKISEERFQVIGCGNIGTDEIERHTWDCVSNNWVANPTDTCDESNPVCGSPGTYSGPFPICCSNQQPAPSPICGPADYDLYTCNGATEVWDQSAVCPGDVPEGVGCNTNDPAVGGDRLCCTSAPNNDRCNNNYNLFTCEYTAPNSNWTFVPPGGCNPATSTNTDCSSNANLVSGDSACCAIAAGDAATIQATCSSSPCQEGLTCSNDSECGAGTCNGLLIDSCVGTPTANAGGRCRRKAGTICNTGSCDPHIDPGVFGIDCDAFDGTNQATCEGTAVWLDATPTQKQFCQWRRNISFVPSCGTYGDSASCNAIGGCSWQSAGTSVCSCDVTPPGTCVQNSPCSTVADCGGAPNFCSSGGGGTANRYTYANARTYNRTGLDHLICLEPEESVTAPSLRDALDQIFGNNSFTTGAGNPAIFNPGSTLQERFVKSIMVSAGVIPGIGTVNDDSIRAAQVMGTSSSFGSPPECLAAAGWSGPITEYLYEDGDLYSSRRTGPQYLVNKPNGAGGYAVAYQLFIAGPFSAPGLSSCQCSAPPNDGHWFVCGADGNWKMGPAANSTIPAAPANLTPVHACSGSSDPIHNDAGAGGYNFTPGDLRCWNAIPSNCSCFQDPNNPAENC